MKNFFAPFLFLIACSSFASSESCTHVTKNGKIRGLKAVEDVEIKMTDAHVKIWNDFYGKNRELSNKCRELMSSSMSFTASGKVFFTYRTNEDSCDGGNVFGIIINGAGKVVVAIQDGDFYCPRNHN